MGERSTPRIELVYFEGCPNAGMARANLDRVLASLSRPREWKEWVQDREDTPDWARRLPSPTVLVEGENVAGAVPDSQGPACAPGGAPSVEVIRTALTQREQD